MLFVTNLIDFFFQAKNYINKKIHSESSKEAPHVIVSNSVVSSEPKPGLRNGSVGGLGVGRAPPSVPPRNGSKLETASELEVIGGQRQKYFDTNIEWPNILESEIYGRCKIFLHKSKREIY